MTTMTNAREKEKALGDKICELRRCKGLSQETLGDEIGVSRQTISKWELNEATPSLDNITQLSLFFKVDVKCFLPDGYDNTLSDVAATTDPTRQNRSHLGKVIIFGVLFLATSIITAIIGIISLTSNKGLQTVHTIYIDIWVFIALVILCVIWLLLDVLFLVLMLKKKNCQ